MKTSNKLLIGLVAFVISSTILYTLVLRAQFVKGNIAQNNNLLDVKRVSLKPFRHLVFNGTLILPGPNGRAITIKEQRNIWIHSRKDTLAYMNLTNYNKHLVDHVQRGDTLFISYSIKDIAATGGNYDDNGIIDLYTPHNIATITGICGSINLAGFSQESPMTVKASDNSKVEVQGVKAPSLHVQLEDNAQGSIGQNNAIDTFSYTLGKASFMNSGYSLKSGLVKAQGVQFSDTTISAYSDGDALRYKHMQQYK